MEQIKVAGRYTLYSLLFLIALDVKSVLTAQEKPTSNAGVFAADEQASIAAANYEKALRRPPTHPLKLVRMLGLPIVETPEA